MGALLKARAVAVALAALSAASTAAQEGQAPAAPAVTLRAYGPGGPAPAMREAARLFGARKGIGVEVKAGPTPLWKDRALADADLVFSGAEHMMTDFVQQDLPGLIDSSTMQTLYLRPSAILVRRGNPKRIAGVRDLARPGIKVLVVHGAGQIGMWEDVVGRTGDVKLVDSVRRNIGDFAANSGEAKKRWNSDASYDAWLIWTIWQKEDPAAADLVPTEPQHTIYRPCSIAITRRTQARALAQEFIAFLRSAEGQAIFVKWGWTAP